MLPHQQRVVEEKAELDEKIAKLEAFLLTDLFKGLPKEERIDLRDQLFHMQAYARVLGRRIARF